MIIPALSLLSLALWLTYLVTVLLALRLHRSLRFDNLFVAAVAKPRRQNPPNPVR